MGIKRRVLRKTVTLAVLAAPFVIEQANQPENRQRLETWKKRKTVQKVSRIFRSNIKKQQDKVDELEKKVEELRQKCALVYAYHRDPAVSELAGKNRDKIARLLLGLPLLGSLSKQNFVGQVQLVETQISEVELSVGVYLQEMTALAGNCADNSSYYQQPHNLELVTEAEVVED